VLVVEVLELPQRVQEAALIPDERAVQEFAPWILRHRIRPARSVTVAVMSSASGGRRFSRPRRGLRACATAGTPQVQQPPAPRRLLLASAPRYISGTASRDHGSCPASLPTLDATAVHFRIKGLDLYGWVLAPCLLGCAGTGR
jgi:hypothetical protein